jgi:hypothetical protein
VIFIFFQLLLHKYLHQQQLKEFKHDVVQAVSATEDQSHQAITKAIQVSCDR